MDNKKNNQYYINKIITDLTFVLEHTEDLSQSDLESNEVLVDSVMFRLIQVAEISDKLADDFKERHQYIPCGQ